MIDEGKHNVLGVLVDAVDYDAAVERIIEAAIARQPLAASALAVHGVMTGVLDAAHRYRLNALDLVTPDGQPVRWGLRLLHGVDLPDRVYGPTLMARLLERAAAHALPVFLYGGTATQLEQLSRRLQERLPDLTIAGCCPSRFRRLTPAERDETIGAIEASGAALTFVGLGCPRQEVWAFEARHRLSHPLVAVGAAFAFHAGTLPQAPPLLADRGLEWLFRLVCEPTRLWRRYVLLNPLYVAMITLQWLRLRRFDPADTVPPADEMLHG